MFSGLSRSVSRVPGAPPRWETPPGTPSPSTRTTVQPVVPPGSVKLPTLRPSTAVNVAFSGEAALTGGRRRPARASAAQVSVPMASVFIALTFPRYFRTTIEPMHSVDRVLSEVDRAADELVAFTADLVRIPSVNPPGEEYDACAHFLGDSLARRGFGIEYIAADGRPEHTARYPRVNVIGSRRGGPGAVVHLNGH